MAPQQLSLEEHRELLRRFLRAWHDSIAYQERVLQELAIVLKIDSSQIYYNWVKPPHCQPHGGIRGTKWSFVFHGFADCDLKHEGDGRFLQVSFGPGGRFDVFSAWGALQFVMASKSPWSEYPLLKKYLTAQAPPFNHLSGSYTKLRSLTWPLKQLGLFEVVDRQLLRLKSDLTLRHTRTANDGRRIYEPPDPYNDPEQKIFWDLEVAHAQKLSPLGQELVAADFDEELFAQLWGERVVHENALESAIESAFSQRNYPFSPI